MKDFRLYDIMDFVMDEDFIRWVQEKRPDDEAYWNNWLKSYPEKHLLVAEARQMLESIRVEQKIFTAEEIDQEASRLLQTINGQSLQERPRKLFNQKPDNLALQRSHALWINVNIWLD